MRLFSTWGRDALSRAYVIENIILFLPFGFITPYIWRCMKKPLVCIAFGAVTSIFIELLQLITQRGYCQLDDMVMNVSGAALGYGIYRIIYYFYVKYLFDCSR